MMRDDGSLNESPLYGVTIIAGYSGKYSLRKYKYICGCGVLPDNGGFIFILRSDGYSRRQRQNDSKNKTNGCGSIYNNASDHQRG